MFNSKERKTFVLRNFIVSCYDFQKGLFTFRKKWASFPVQDFIKELNLFITVYKIPLPTVLYSEEDMKRDFAKLKKLQLSQVLVSQPWEHRLVYDGRNLVFRGEGKEETKSASPLVLNNLRKGNVCSHYFSLGARLSVPFRSKSVKDIWTNPELREQALRFFKFRHRTYPEAVSSACFVRSLQNNLCSANAFRPSAAKGLYEMFQAQTIYDFSMGWGDRLIGALASNCVQVYVGTDPNQDNRSIYNSILKSLSHQNPKLVTHLYALPAEELLIHQKFPEFFDMVFTSCPYFHTEKYASGTSHESLQSWYRYKTVQQWLDDFIFPTLLFSWKALKAGGILAINIADCSISNQRVYLCEPINTFLDKTLAMQPLGAIGYKMSRRYGTNLVRNELAYAEPIWIWRKSN
jgi:hypothetical protein